VPLLESVSAGVVVAERYHVLEPLARGGFGAVYVAEQLATERRVALKVLWPHVLENVRAREQFTLEARVASRINSENVVQVLDAGVDERNDITYLVMELLEGVSAGLDLAHGVEAFADVALGGRRHWRRFLGVGRRGGRAGLALESRGFRAVPGAQQLQ
jgi:Protein kinase domain